VNEAFALVGLNCKIVDGDVVEVIFTKDPDKKTDQYAEVWEVPLTKPDTVNLLSALISETEEDADTVTPPTALG
jgi:hypothetical protein